MYDCISLSLDETQGILVLSSLRHAARHLFWSVITQKCLPGAFKFGMWVKWYGPLYIFFVPDLVFLYLNFSYFDNSYPDILYPACNISY